MVVRVVRPLVVVPVMIALTGMGAPLALAERGLMALMALPLELIAALLTVRTCSLWGNAQFHLLVIGAMLGSLR